MDSLEPAIRSPELRVPPALPSVLNDPGERPAPRPVPPGRSGVVLRKLIVSAYKVAGFCVLTAILVGLGSYLFSTLFYLFSHNWVTPTVISPTDERVLQLNGQLVQQYGAREKLLAERSMVLANLDDAARVYAAQQAFESFFRRALSADLGARLDELQNLGALADKFAMARNEIEKSTQAFSTLSRQRMQVELGAGLLKNDQVVSGNLHLAEIAQANLSLAEREMQLKTRTAELTREADALAGAAAGLGHARNRGPISSDVLKLQQDYMRWVLEGARARGTREALKQALAGFDRSIERADQMLKAIEESPLLKAVQRKSTVAFVPYDNLDGARVGAPLYSCRIGMLWCRRVGQLVEILPGEVTSRHVLHNTMERGLMAQVALEDQTAAQNKVLFTGRPPLLF